MKNKKVTLIMAMTADGKIAKDNSHAANWTSREDKKIFVEISKKFGIIIMGENTFKTLSSPLPGRLNVVFTRKENLLPVEGVKWVKGNPDKVLRELESMGYKRMLLGGGTYLNTLFLASKLIDEIIITVEPKIFGQGLGIFNGNFDIDLELTSLKKINKNSFIAKYKVIYKD